jgi:diguanylate cyclase (GGDEF)-like protein
MNQERLDRPGWLSGLLLKFLLLLTPLFLVLAIPGVGFLVQYEMRETQDSLAMRIANNAARIATSLTRHAWQDDITLAEDLVAPLTADAAVLCVELRADPAGAPALAHPLVTGCGVDGVGDTLTLPLEGAGQGTLTLRFDDAALQRGVQLQNLIANSVVGLSFVLAVIAATIGFRVIVNRPLGLLIGAMRRSIETGERQPVDWRRRDELGELVEAFNVMLARDGARETELREAKASLEASEAELLNVNELLEELVDERTRGLEEVRARVEAASQDLALQTETLGHEIESRVVAERERDEASATLRGAIESISEGFAIWDADDRLVMTNSKYLEMFSEVADILVSGVAFTDFLQAAVERGVYGTEGQDMETFIVSRLAEHRHLGEPFERQIGNGRWLRISNRPTDSGGVVGIWSDVTERRQAEETIRELALTDPLTGLANRRHLHDRLDHALAIARRMQTRVAILFLDLDRLKSINDEYGHAAGDGLIKQVAVRLSALLRASDTVARLGGDEFAVVMSNLEDIDAVRILAQRIIDSVAEPFDVDGQRIETSTSIGISIYPDDDEDTDELIRKADVALYQVKAEGRGAYNLYDGEMHAEARQQSQLENELRVALDEGQLLFHYQPQLDVSGREVIGGEALVRWQHPERGLLAPGHFIGAAESSGLIVELGELALRCACRQARDWIAQGLPPTRVAVNISPRQFRSSRLVESVAEALRESGIPAHLLELEITESMMLDEIESTKERLEGLHALGVDLTIDDFGTGYSCLAYLKHFPVQRLKIDKSFVDGVTEDADTAAIVEAVVRLGHSLRMQVLAEGIETGAQQARLQALGCDEVQGYYFGKPVPPETFAADLAARSELMAS